MSEPNNLVYSCKSNYRSGIKVGVWTNTVKQRERKDKRNQIIPYNNTVLNGYTLCPRVRIHLTYLLALYSCSFFFFQKVILTMAKITKDTPPTRYSLAPFVIMNTHTDTSEHNVVIRKSPSTYDSRCLYSTYRHMDTCMCACIGCTGTKSHHQIRKHVARSKLNETIKLSVYTLHTEDVY